VKKGNSGKAEPKAAIRNKTAATDKEFFLPKREDKNPESNPPMMQPIKALETVAPNAKFPNPLGVIKNASNDSTVPEITAVSYPKSNPPIVATKVIRKI